MWGPGWGDTLPLAPTFLGAPFLPYRGALRGVATKVPRWHTSSQGTGAAAATPSSHQSAALPKTAPAATGGVGPAGHWARLARLRFDSTSVQHPCPPSAGPCAQIGEGAWPLCPHPRLRQAQAGKQGSWISASTVDSSGDLGQSLPHSAPSPQLGNGTATLPALVCCEGTTRWCGQSGRRGPSPHAVLMAPVPLAWGLRMPGRRQCQSAGSAGLAADLQSTQAVKAARLPGGWLAGGAPGSSSPAAAHPCSPLLSSLRLCAS